MSSVADNQFGSESPTQGAVNVGEVQVIDYYTIYGNMTTGGQSNHHQPSSQAKSESSTDKSHEAGLCHATLSLGAPSLLIVPVKMLITASRL